jgi:hypothetical protein
MIQMSGKHKAMMWGGLLTIIALMVIGKMRMTEASS